MFCSFALLHMATCSLASNFLSSQCKALRPWPCMCMRVTLLRRNLMIFCRNICFLASSETRCTDVVFVFCGLLCSFIYSYRQRVQHCVLGKSRAEKSTSQWLSHLSRRMPRLDTGHIDGIYLGVFSACVFLELSFWEILAQMKWKAYWLEDGGRPLKETAQKNKQPITQQETL